MTEFAVPEYSLEEVRGSMAVGSENGMKCTGVVLGASLALEGGNCITWPAESGEPDQPKGRPQTMRGAENRGRQARGESGRLLGFGLESGTYGADDEDSPDMPGPLYVFAAVYVVDWAGREERAYTKAYALPPDVAEGVRGGLEVIDAIKAVRGADAVTGRDCIRALTDGEVFGHEFFAHGVWKALCAYRDRVFG